MTKEYVEKILDANSVDGMFRFTKENLKDMYRIKYGKNPPTRYNKLDIIMGLKCPF